MQDLTPSRTGSVEGVSRHVYHYLTGPRAHHGPSGHQVLNDFNLAPVCKDRQRSKNALTRGKNVDFALGGARHRPLPGYDRRSKTNPITTGEIEHHLHTMNEKKKDTCHIFKSRLRVEREGGRRVADRIRHVGTAGHQDFTRSNPVRGRLQL